MCKHFSEITISKLCRKYANVKFKQALSLKLYITYLLVDTGAFVNEWNIKNKRTRHYKYS